MTVIPPPPLPFLLAVRNATVVITVPPVIHNIKQHDVDKIEIVYLTVIILIGIPLNVNAFIRLIRQPKMPTATTSFLTGPYYTSSFVLFKLNLSITDFAILLIHALGKVIWLLTYDWKFGDIGCRAYQFLSAFTYYSNSNVVVAIGIDRLIVVYTSHIQGATSKRRVRLLLFCTWLTAAFCALPQIFVWTSVEVSANFYQCTTVWQVSAHRNSPTYQNSRKQILYETFHQSIVFWLPFFTLLASYVLIILKVLRYTLVFVGNQEQSSCSSLHTERAANGGGAQPRHLHHHHHPQLYQAKFRGALHDATARCKSRARKSASYQMCIRDEKSSNKFLLGALSIDTLNNDSANSYANSNANSYAKVSAGANDNANSKSYVNASANSYVNANSNGKGNVNANANANGSGLLSLKRVESDLSGYYTNMATMTTNATAAASPNNNNNNNNNGVREKLRLHLNTTQIFYNTDLLVKTCDYLTPRSAADAAAVTTSASERDSFSLTAAASADNNSMSETLIAGRAKKRRTNGAKSSANISNVLGAIQRFIDILKRKVANNVISRGSSAAILAATNTVVVSPHRRLLHSPCERGYSQPTRSAANPPQRHHQQHSHQQQHQQQHNHQQQQQFVSCSQVWKRQLRSRVFATSLAIVITHCALWLPYNLLNSLRFINADLYEWMVNNGGFLLEDLIVLNSVVNPILYGYESKWVICKSTR